MKLPDALEALANALDALERAVETRYKEATDDCLWRCGCRRAVPMPEMEIVASGPYAIPICSHCRVRRYGRDDYIGLG